MNLKIVIADDHPLVLNGMRRALEQEEGIEVVGEAQSGDEVLSLVARESPGMVLMDIRMPGIDGLTCLDTIRRRNPEVKVILISAFSDVSEIRDALDRGASAYIAKTVNPVDLASVLRQASDGTVWSAPSSPLGGSQDMPAGADLTEREITILRAIAKGLSNKAISREYWVTEQTVKFHLTNIYRKLGVPNRTAAARYAHQHGLLEDPAATPYAQTKL
jgi:NarL family two-component system response regulator LiaR